MDVESITNDVVSVVATYAPSLVGAIAVFIIGWWIAGSLTKVVGNVMQKRNLDPTIIPFLRSIVGALLKIGVVISAASVAGIETASFVAILGAAGLAVGLALQGSLANFAGGVLILALKPYKVGDVIEANGVTGAVTEIQIFYTILDLPTKQRVVIPNAQLSNNLIKNYSVHDTRRMDVVIGIAYDDDIDKAKSVLADILAADSRFLKDPAPSLFVSELGDSAVNINVRAYTTNEDYWAALGDIYEVVKKRFDKEGLNFPFPQRDIHVFNEK